MNRIKITHWGFTGLLVALLLLSSVMYLFNTAEIKLHFPELGFPSWLVYPMAIAKLLAVLMLITKFKTFLTEWAYAGILFNLLLAAGAHISVGDGEAGPVIVGLILCIGSYITWKLGWPNERK